MGAENIEYFFAPKSVGVIGASRDPKKFGHIIFRNLLEGSKKVYPVNPNAEEILGKKCYANVKEIPEPVDLVVIAVPQEHAIKAVEDCREKGVRAAVIITAGFAEAGNQESEAALLRKKGDMRIIGPNVIGLYDAYSGIDTVFNLRHRQQRPRPGQIAFISQSGAFGSAVLDSASFEGIGLSKFVSLGNMADVNETDMLEYLANDDQTKIIAMYLEGSKNYRALHEKLKSSKKPVIIVKAGKTKQSGRAVASHTASLAGEAGIFSGMVRQAGCVEVSSSRLLGVANAFGQPLPKNTRAQIVTDGGGFGILAADALVKSGLRLARLSDSSVNKIKNFVPSYASVSNPLDLTGDADTARYRNVLPVVLSDSGVDAVVLILLMQISALDSNIVDAVASAKRFNKPIFVCMSGGEYTLLHRRMLEEKGIPTYSSPEETVEALGHLSRYNKARQYRAAF